jgi:hypothetical protein
MGWLFRALGAFLSHLWRVANFWRVSPIGEARVGSPLAGGLLFLFLVFASIGLVLMMLGFDLNEVDIWLDAQGGWLDVVGRVLFRGLVWVIFLFCVAACAVMVWSLFTDRESLKPLWGSLLTGLFMAFIAWMCSASLFAPL